MQKFQARIILQKNLQKNTKILGSTILQKQNHNFLSEGVHKYIIFKLEECLGASENLRKCRIQSPKSKKSPAARQKYFRNCIYRCPKFKIFLRRLFAPQAKCLNSRHCTGSDANIVRFSAPQTPW